VGKGYSERPSPVTQVEHIERCEHPEEQKNREHKNAQECVGEYIRYSNCNGSEEP